MCVVNTNLLRSKMALKGFNIGTLAEEIGVDRDTISRILNNKSKPSYPVMNSIFYTLDLTPQEATDIFFAKELTQNAS